MTNNQSMTMRDEFAAAALVGLMAEPQWRETFDPLVSAIGGSPHNGLEALYARAAYKIADAMMKARGE